jgi:hypothetical protein
VVREVQETPQESLRVVVVVQRMPQVRGKPVVPVAREQDSALVVVAVMVARTQPLVERALQQVASVAKGTKGTVVAHLEMPPQEETQQPPVRVVVVETQPLVVGTVQQERTW